MESKSETTQPAATAERGGCSTAPLGSASPVTDDAWDAYNRKACGLHYIAHKMREMEVRLIAAQDALSKIINQQPCCEGGGCFYPMHDGEGNYIGEQNVDPLSVIGGMVQTAQDALTPNDLAQ